jgi:O-Antigen ligase
VASQGEKRLTPPSLAVPPLGTAIAVAAAGVAAGLGLAAAIETAGPIGALAPAVALLGLILLRFPGAALALLLGGAVLVEVEAAGIIPPVASFYDVVGGSLTLQDLLILAGLGGVLLRFATESERPRLPEPLTAPLALLGVAIVGGAVMGYYSSAAVSPGELFHRSLTAFYLILVPLLVVNVVRDTRTLRAFAATAAALAAFKAISGLYAALGGLGQAVETETISYLNPVPNFVMLVFVLGVAAALVRRVRLPAWMLVSAPLALFALVLSYRRSFWVAAAFTLVVVIIIASRQRGRTLAAMIGVAAALGLGGTLLVGTSDDPSASPLVTRAKTISPGGLGSNRGDRYRMDERSNVIENLREHPLTGIGLGVPWEVHQPLAESHDRRYAHFAALWYWLSFGLIGMIAYFIVLGTGLWTAIGVWRRHPNDQIRVSALACFGGLLALLVVELTATFTGVEQRSSLVVGAVLGWLVAAWADLPENTPAATAGPGPRA